MKHHKFQTFGWILLLAGLLAGCVTGADGQRHVSLAAVNESLFRKESQITPAATNLVPQYATVPAATNADGALVPEHTEVVGFMPVVTPARTNEVWSKGTVLKSAETGVQLIPGYGQIAAVALSGLGNLWLLWLNRRNKKASVSLVQGIDTILTGLAATGEKGAVIAQRYREILKTVQDDYQVRGLVDQLIEEYTGYGGDPKVAASLRAAVA